MSRKGTIAVILSLIGMLAMASCGGSALTSPEITSQNESQVAGPMIADAPPSEKEILEWGGYELDDSIIEIDELIPDIDWSALGYQSMSSGVNSLDLYNVTSKNAGTYTHYNGVMDELYLRSETGEMGFAMFGLKDIPAGEQIMAVRVGGEGYFGADEDDGLYIALGDAANDTYKWSGPYKNGEEWSVINLHMDTVTDANHAFIVLAVYDGDDAAIYDIEVEIGEPFTVELPEIEFEYPELLIPGPGPMEELGPLGPEIFELLDRLLITDGIIYI